MNTVEDYDKAYGWWNEPRIFEDDHNEIFEALEANRKNETMVWVNDRGKIVMGGKTL